MDNSLPDGSGVNGVKIIREFEGNNFINILENNQLSLIPIFSISGSEVEEMKKQYDKYSVQKFLQKPVCQKELITQIRQFLK